MSHRSFKSQGRSWEQTVADQQTTVANNQLQQAAGKDSFPVPPEDKFNSIIPMAVGQKYLRRDGKVVMIVKEHVGINNRMPSKYFTCSDKWCYLCKTVDPENGWNVYSFEANDEDLVALLPIGAIAGTETKN